jgi:glycosyltransferase involved in cell wall biosynthesis
VNTEIIRHGENGYLAAKTEEWVEIISQLIESPELRKQIGDEARATVVARYSVLSQRDVYLKAFDGLCEANQVQMR